MILAVNCMKWEVSVFSNSFCFLGERKTCRYLNKFHSPVVFIDLLFRSSTAKPSQKSPNPKKSRSPTPPASMRLSVSNPSLSPGNLRPNRVNPESSRVSPEGEGGKKGAMLTSADPPKTKPETPVTKPDPSAGE